MHPIILIPVYNGQKSIVRLLEQIRRVTETPIMVVNDGSTDGLTVESLPKVVYLEHLTNRGKGAALKTGLSYAQSLGYSHALTLDADGQHDPGLITTFLKQANQCPDSVIVGARDLGNQSMPLHRKLSNNITSMILSLRTGYHIRDSQVGYRCYPLRDSRLWNSIEDGFQFESDILFNVAKLHLRLIWQPIPVIYGTEESHMNLVKDTLRFVRTFFRSFM